MRLRENDGQPVAGKLQRQPSMTQTPPNHVVTRDRPVPGHVPADACAGTSDADPGSIAVCSTAWNGRTPHSAHARNGLPNSTPPSERCSPRDCRSCCIGEKNSFRSTTTRSCPFWATSTRTRSAGRRRNAGRRSGKPWNRTFAAFWPAVIPCCTSDNCCSSIGTVISRDLLDLLVFTDHRRRWAGAGGIRPDDGHRHRRNPR